MKLSALTDTALRSAKPRTESYRMFDGGGLFVLVKPNGSMLWRYKFKLGGREKLLPRRPLRVIRFEMEWPPRSGQLQTFPEVDRAEWFTLPIARTKIIEASAPTRSAGKTCDYELKLRNDVVSGLRRGIVNPYLKHRESALQLLRAASSAFRRRELGLQLAVDFDRETGSRQFGMDLWHLQLIRMGWRAVHACIFLTVSRLGRTSVPSGVSRVAGND